VTTAGALLRRAGARGGGAGGAKVLTVLGVLALWQLVSSTGALAADVIPAPAAIGVSLVEVLGGLEFWQALGLTLLSWAVGLLVSICLAVPVGLLLGASELGYRSCRFTIDFLRTIPPVALVPLALLLYGATTQMKLVLVVLGAVWPLLLQSMYGVHQVDLVARETARSYQLGRWLRTAFVILPSAAPYVFTGVRIAATMALLLTIGAEVIGGAPGLGAAMALAQTANDIPRLFALVAASAVLGVLINTLLARVERRALSWHVSQRPSR